MSDWIELRVSPQELRILISALLNSDEFIDDDDYPTVMGNTKAEGWKLMDRLIAEKERLGEGRSS